MDFIVFSCILCDTNYTHNQSAHPTASPRSALAAPGRLLRAVSGGGAGAGAGAGAPPHQRAEQRSQEYKFAMHLQLTPETVFGVGLEYATTSSGRT